MKYNEINLPNRSVRYRAFVVSIILIPINIYWNVQMELVRYSGLPTTISLFFNVIFNLLVLSLANIGVKRLSQVSYRSSTLCFPSLQVLVGTV